MKKLIYTFAIVARLSACTADLEDKQVVVADSTPVSAKILNGSRGCVKGSIIVRFNPSAESRLGECATRSGATRTGVRGVDALLDEVGGYSVEPIFIVTKKNCEKVYAGGYHLWYELSFDESSDMEKVASRLAEVGEIERVQYVHRIKRVGAPKAVATENSADAPVTRASYNNPFNDPHAIYQWGLENLGSGGLVTPSLSGLGKAVAGADAVYTDVWASMGQEEEAEARKKIFSGYQINSEVMSVAHEDAMVLHCLPAHREEEITAEVFEAHAAEIFEEAENRLHAQKAVMVKCMGDGTH